MKSLIWLLILILCFSCSNNSERDNVNSAINKKDAGLVLIGTLKATYSNYINKNDRYYYYLVELKLINNSKTDCEFYTLTCSSLINIITDSKEASFLYHNCTTDIAVPITLRPKQEYHLPVILFRNKYYKWFNPNVRFGFLLYKPKSGLFAKNPPMTNEELISEIRSIREKQENVIWSELVALTATNYGPYEIKDIVEDSD